MRATALAAAGIALALAVAAPSVARTADTGSTQEPDYRRALRISQAAIGRTVGEHPLRTSAGGVTSLRELRGKPVIVSFVYTGCFQACPVATQFLAKAVRVAREALGEDRFRVVTIGFNQPFDGPEEMAHFARQSGIRERDWWFVSPHVKDVEAVTAELGFVYEATPKGFDHIAQVTVIDAQGVVYRQVYGENFEMPMLVGPLKELIAGEAATRVSLEDIWTKVKLYCTVYDPYSGGYRLNYSLFVEIFAGLTFVFAVSWWMMRESARRRA